MGRYLVPATMVGAMLGLAVAAAAVGFVPSRPAWWPAAVALAILGGIAPMIYAVNIRIVPVFARRSWPGLGWLRLQVGFAFAGAWAVFLGRLDGNEWVAFAGSMLALGGGLTFFANLIRLFRRPASPLPAPPLPFPEQAAVDHLATHFMRLSGTYLLVGLGVGVLNSRWQPTTGRWDLVWAHALLVGFFLSMASGVCYHVLSRWTGRRWRSILPIRLHLLTVAVGLPLMLIALATNARGLFAVAGPLQAAALVLFLLTILPLVPGLPGLSGPAVLGAMLFLIVGVGLGAAFAADAALGARLRLVHAEVNLFGWTGLLISGVGYYLAPRFAGKPLRWPRLASVQLALLGGGSLAGALALLWRAEGGGSPALVAVAQAPIALGFGLFALLLAGTFAGKPGVAVALTLPPRGAGASGPRRPVASASAPMTSTRTRGRAG